MKGGTHPLVVPLSEAALAFSTGCRAGGRTAPTCSPIRNSKKPPHTNAVQFRTPLIALGYLDTTNFYARGRKGGKLWPRRTASAPASRNGLARRWIIAPRRSILPRPYPRGCGRPRLFPQAGSRHRVPRRAARHHGSLERLLLHDVAGRQRRADQRKEKEGCCKSYCRQRRSGTR